MHSIHLAQRFGFVPDSSSQTVDGQAHFVCQGVGVLLGHKHNVSTSARAFGGRTRPRRTEPAEPHLRVCLRVHPDHVLGAGGSHEGARLSVLLRQRVDGLLQPRWAHGPSLRVCCVYHPAVRHLKKQIGGKKKKKKAESLTDHCESDTDGRTLVH